MKITWNMSKTFFMSISPKDNADIGAVLSCGLINILINGIVCGTMAQSAIHVFPSGEYVGF